MNKIQPSVPGNTHSSNSQPCDQKALCLLSKRLRKPHRAQGVHVRQKQLLPPGSVQRERTEGALSTGKSLSGILRYEFTRGTVDGMEWARAGTEDCVETFTYNKLQL